MINLSNEEIKALHGNRVEYYKLTLVDRYGVEKCELEMIEGTISANKDRAIQRTGKVRYRVPSVTRKVEDRSPYSTYVITSLNGVKFLLGVETNGMLSTTPYVDLGSTSLLSLPPTLLQVGDDRLLFTEENGTGAVDFQLVDENGFTWNVGVDTDGMAFTEDTTIAQQLFYRDEVIEVDFLNDRVKVYMGIQVGNQIRWWPKGLYVHIKPKIKNGIVESSLYDETINLQRTRILDNKVFLKGTNYNEVLSYLLIYSGIIQMNIEPTTLVLQADVVLNSTKNNLEWFNYFAEQINFTNISVDDDGFFTSVKYVEPTPLNVGYVYRADDMSVITGDLDRVVDNYNIHNVFRRIVAHPQLGEMVSTYINDDPTDKYSTVNTFMNFSEENVDLVGSQIELDNIARKAAWEAKQVTEEITFSTLNMPHHTTGDILDIRHPDANGIVVESGWSMTLKAGARMTHNVKRLVILND